MVGRRAVAGVLALLLFSLFSPLLARPAWAATIVVNDLGDAGPGNCTATCTLRDAVATAASGDTIIFSVMGTISLTTGQILINGKTLTIIGPGADRLTVRRDSVATSFRIFQILDSTVAISRLTISNGDTREVGDPSGLGAGGGIYAERATLTLRDCAVTGNRSQRDGGGILHEDGTLTVERCTISGNMAGTFGGGIANISKFQSLTTATVTSSTISGNSASAPFDGGGGIDNFADTGSAVVTLESSTVANNAAQGSGSASSISNNVTTGASAPFFVQNSILTSNARPSITGNFGVVSRGNNLATDNPIALNQPTDLRNADPRIGPLQDNRGPTETHALLAGSPAIDAGSSPAGNDQRGFQRPGAGIAADIGAFEVQPPSIDLNGPVAGIDSSASFSEGGSPVPIVNASGLTVTDNDSANLASATVRIVNPFDGASEILGFSTAGTSVSGSYNPATSTLSLTGTRPLAEYQQVLRTVTYRNTSSNPTAGTREVRFTPNDGVVSGRVATSSVTVGAVNNPPVNGVPAAASTDEDTPLVFSLGNPNGYAISLADPDVGGGALSVQLTVDQGGTLTLNGTAGLTVTGGANGSGSLTVTGPLAALNTALNGLTLAFPANVNGAATVQITTNDQQTGVPGGAQTDHDTIPVTVVAVNDLPTVTAIADQSTAEDTPVGPLGITVGDVETPAGSLTLAGTSNNQTLVPNANITFGGSGASRTVTVTPAANQSGTATITVTVHDADGGTASTAFLLTVSSVNTAPTISNITDQTTPEDTALGPLAFTVGDTETAPGDLILSATSSDPAVVPNGNIVFGGSGASRTVTITPAPNAFGPTTVTVTVSDGAATTSDTFLVTVTPVNDPPTITAIPDLSTPENTPLGPIPFTVGDAETAPGSLTLTGTSNNPALVPDANIVVGGTGADRTVTVTPVANLNGSATITLTVSDGQGGQASEPFLLTVSNVNQLPTISAIPDQSTAENGVVGPLGITVGDVETPAASLTLAGASNNQTLVPNASITFGGSGASRTVTVTPSANASGAATITVTVTDADGGTATTAFLLTVGAVNSPPTISNIADQTTPEDTALGPLALTVGDTETAPADLTLSATSSDPAVVPNGNIVVGGSGASRTVTITPASNAFGPTTITITVSDGAATASDSFVLTVTPVNDPPTLTAIPDLGTPENTPLGPIPFTIGDAETPAGSLTVTGTSSNQALVPDAGIVFGGSGANRTLTVTPRANQNGTATIAVTVSDGQGGQTSDQVVLTVSGVNDPPTISAISDQSTSVGGVVGPLPFTVSDLETVPTSLTVAGTSSNLALVPNGNITFGGIGTNRTVIVTPAPDQTGTATITVTVTDGQGGQSSEQFVVAVTPALATSGCSPRPEIRTRTAVVGGALQVTILLTPSPALPNNALQTVAFGAATNARVEVPAQAGVPAAQTGPGGFAVELVGGVREVTFTVRRQVAGQPTTVPLVVTDACGEWRTLVGGGSQAGF